MNDRGSRARTFAIFALVLPLAFAGRLLAASTAPKQPDIIFILIDTLRADHLGCYGYPQPTSPTIDDIASRSIVFTSAIAPAPWTVPSIASIFTSVYPSDHRVLYHTASGKALAGPQATNALSNQFDTLAEQLKAAGYFTAAFIANPWIDRRFGYAQGFDEFEVIRKGGGYRTGDVVNQHVLEWLRTHPVRQPLFLYVHYMDVHGPYDAPAEFRKVFVEPLRARAERGELTTLHASGRAVSPRSTADVDHKLAGFLEYWVARYDACIRFVDSNVSELRNGLHNLGRWDSAVVVITADHGQELGEHGGSAHGFTLFDDQLAVPLIIRRPGDHKSDPINATVSLLDLTPTLCDLAGADVPERAIGRSLISMLNDAAKRRPAYAFSEGVRDDPTQASVQLGRRKLIANSETGEMTFYDLALDPTEQSPIHVPPDDSYAQLSAAMRRWLHRARASDANDAPTVTIDPDLERTLKSLGYLQDADD